MSTVKTHGSAARIARSVPQLDITFSTESRSVQVVRPTEFEVCFQVDRDVIAIPTETATCHVSYDTDVVREETYIKGRVNYLPAGSRIYSRTTSAGAALLSFDVETYVRRNLEDEFDIVFPSEVVTNVDCGPLSSLLRNTFALSKSQGVYGRLAIEELSLSALGKIAKPRIAGRDLTLKPQLPPQQLKRFLGFLDMCLMDDLDLTMLSDAVAMTPSELTYAFETATGMPLSQFVLERRIAVAMELLQDRSLSVATVAEDVGLTCRDTLARVFTTRVGVSPEEYRSRSLN